MVSSVAAIILAAGESRRMGCAKLLLPLGEHTIIEQTVDNFVNSKVDRVIVVAGCRAEVIANALKSQPITMVENPIYSRGISTSIIAGLGAVGGGARGIIIALGDQPFVDSPTIDHLVEAFRTHGNNKGIIIPVCQGKRGHPIIFSRKYIDELRSITGDIGGRQVVDKHPDDILEVPVDCEGINIDIDVMKDYNFITRKAGT